MLKKVLSLCLSGNVILQPYLNKSIEFVCFQCLENITNDIDIIRQQESDLQLIMYE